MGYYTSFEIKTMDEVSDIVKAAISHEIEAYHLPDYNEWMGGWACYGKWYDHEEDLKELSLKFPDVVFEVYGDGEESDDLWYKYFKNGRMQYCPCHFEFDPYDESKLE